MPSMNPQTMTWSLRLSRWKHMVETSLSAAPLHIGSDCDRQKLRLHWLQEEDEELPCARRDTFRCRRRSSSMMLLMSASSASSSAAAAIMSSRPAKLRASGSSSWLLLLSGSVVSPPDRGWCCEGGFEDEPPVEDLGLISMIVLLVKQVHLQNVGAAVYINAGQFNGLVQGGQPVPAVN